jgi:hypothetical protein
MQLEKKNPAPNGSRSDPQRALDRQAGIITSSIRAAANIAFVKPRALTRCLNPSIISKSCSHLIDQRTFALARLQAGIDTDPSSYQQLCRRVRSLIRTRKRQVRSAQIRKLEDIAKAGKPFWDMFAKITSRASASALPDSFAKSDGSLSNGRPERLQTARDFFSALSSPSVHSDPSIAPPSLAPHPTVFSERQSALSKALNLPLRPGEVRNALFLLKAGVAPGPDEIPGALLKFGGDSLADSLYELFEQCWKLRRLPASFCEGYVALLHKSGDTSMLDNYRGLSLLNSMSKVMELVLKARIVPLTETFLSDSQAGFRPDRRCLDNQVLLLEIISERRERSLPTFVTFVDIRKAYDSVWRSGLWALLERIGVTGTMLDLLKALTGHVSRKIRIQGELSDPFECHRGVPQGSVLSPILYDIFIDSLLAELNNTDDGVSCCGDVLSVLAFADDLALLSKDHSGMTRQLQRLKTHAVEWRYSVNVAKCASLLFSSPSRRLSTAPSASLMFDGQPLPLDQNYPYLGIPSSVFRGSTSHFAKEKADAARAKLPVLSGYAGARFNGLRPSLAVSLWQALIRPGLEWGIELLSAPPSVMRGLDAVLPAALRTFVGTDSFVPNDALMAEFGTQSLSSRQQELSLRLFKRLCTLSSDRVLSRVFRARCQQVDNGVAPFSLFQSIKALLLRFELEEVWYTRPQDPSHALWLRWESRIHSKAIKLDLIKRKAAILARPSLSLFSQVKPLDVQCVPSYLDRRGLGSWVKLKLRTSSLPLGDFLLRHSKLSLDASQSFCKLCSLLVVESPLHFVSECPSLLTERDNLADSLASDDSFMALHGSSELLSTWRGPSSTRLLLILSSVESICRSGHSKGKKQVASVAGFSFVCSTALLARFEALSLPFLAKIWLRRAALLKGVPSLDIKGESIVLTQLREDGRCRFFAVGSSSSSSRSDSSHAFSSVLPSVQSLDSGLTV